MPAKVVQLEQLHGLGQKRKVLFHLFGVGQVVNDVDPEPGAGNNALDLARGSLVGACLCGDIAQVVGAAGGPTVGQEQLHAELFVQPAVEGPVPVGKGLLHGGGVGQQEIAVPAAAVNDVGPGQAAAVQQLVHVVLHEQFQKERTAAEGTQGTLGVDGVDEPLDAGKVGGVEQERRFPAQLCGSVQQGKGHC